MDALATVPLLVRLAAKAIPWLVVRFFSEQKLDLLLHIYPMPTGDAVDVYYPGRRATCWLHVINLTPFPVQIDRLEVKVIAHSLSLKIQKILPEVVPSLSSQSLHCEGSFDADPAIVQIASKVETIRIEVHGYATCSVRSFRFSRFYGDIKGFRIYG